MRAPFTSVQASLNEQIQIKTREMKSEDHVQMSLTRRLDELLQERVASQEKVELFEERRKTGNRTSASRSWPLR